MANIIPSILTDDFAEAQRQLDALAGLTEWAQIDVMDGIFVDTKSFEPEKLNALQTDISLEIHLMVADPAAWLSYVNPALFKRVYFHYESTAEPEELMKQIREADFMVGLANKLETPISAFADYVDMADSVLFMSVRPGQQGQQFHPEVLQKIQEFANQFPDHQIGIDGGVTLALLPEIVKAGVDDIGVGSLISQSDDPATTLHILQEQLN